MPPPGFRCAQAARVIAAGGVVACPTEAVWGLSCDPFNEEAVLRLLSLKQRPVDKGLILVADHIERFSWLLEGLSGAQRSRLELSWPGATTWLVPHHGRIPTWISGSHSSVALRVTAHPVMAALSKLTAMPLVSTSANRGGAQAAREQFQVRRYFGGALDDVVAGNLGGNRNPSVIRDLLSDNIIRPG